MFTRNNVAALVAEFLGTATLATVVFSMVGRTTFPFFAGTMAGLTLGVMVLAIGSTSGAHLNPAVTLGLWTLRKISTAKAAMYVAVQMLAGLSVWALLTYLLNKSVTSLAGKNFDWRVFIAEALGTMIFTFGIASAVYQGYQGVQLALTIGASLTLGILVASVASNGVLNPAVAVGIQSWDLTYAIAPLVGSVVGMNLYALIFAPSGSFASLKSTSAAVTKSSRKKTTQKKAQRKGSKTSRR